MKYQLKQTKILERESLTYLNKKLKNLKRMGLHPKDVKGFSDHLRKIISEALSGADNIAYQANQSDLETKLSVFRAKYKSLSESIDEDDNRILMLMRDIAQDELRVS